MADPSPLAGLLDRAGNVFSLAFQLGRTFQEEREAQGGVPQVDPKSWDRHQSAFNKFCAAVLDLRDAMQNPPEGFTPVAQALLEAARVAKQIRDAMQTADGRTWAAYLNLFPELNSVAASGRQAIREGTKARPQDDPFAFVDQQAEGKEPGIDTTPTLPMPPTGLIEYAARGIPAILANVPPRHDVAIELVASHLAKRLQDANHTLAAAQWAIHEAVRVGHLEAGHIEVDLPSSGHQVGRRAMYGLPDTRRMEWTGGGKATIAIPEGEPAPFDAFKVTATESLWRWWRSLGAAESGNDETPTTKSIEGLLAGSEDVELTPREAEAPEKSGEYGAAVGPVKPAPKRSTGRGEGRTKLIAALSKHHQYADGGCLNLEPIGNNELAKAAGVYPSTASGFFKREFGSHGEYKALCRRDLSGLIGALKLLNGDVTPKNLYGRRPPNEDDRHKDE